MIKLINKIMWVCEIILITLLGSVILLVATHVLMRYVIKSPLSWTEQIARFGFIWMVMLGIPVMFNRNIKISFDVILMATAGKLREYLENALKIIGMAFTIFYFKAVFQLMLKTGGRVTPGIQIPYNLLYGAQAVCAFLLFFVFLKQIIENRAKFREEKGDTK